MNNPLSRNNLADVFVDINTGSSDIPSGGKAP